MWVFMPFPDTLESLETDMGEGTSAKPYFPKFGFLPNSHDAKKPPLTQKMDDKFYVLTIEKIRSMEANSMVMFKAIEDNIARLHTQIEIVNEGETRRGLKLTCTVTNHLENAEEECKRWDREVETEIEIACRLETVLVDGLPFKDGQPTNETVLKDFMECWPRSKVATIHYRDNGTAIITYTVKEGKTSNVIFDK